LSGRVRARAIPPRRQRYFRDGYPPASRKCVRKSCPAAFETPLNAPALAAFHHGCPGCAQREWFWLGLWPTGISPRQVASGKPTFHSESDRDAIHHVKAIGGMGISQQLPERQHVSAFKLHYQADRFRVRRHPTIIGKRSATSQDSPVRLRRTERARISGDKGIFQQLSGPSSPSRAFGSVISSSLSRGIARMIC